MIKIILFITLLFCTINLFAEDSTKDNTQKKQMNGWDYFSAGRYKESLQTLEAEKKQFPDRNNIYVIMAWNYRELKDFTSMESISLEGLKIKLDDARILRNLGEAYYYQKKHNECISAFEKYFKYKNSWTDSYIPYAYYYTGVSYYYLKQYRKSDISLTTSNFYLPKNYNTLILLAEVKEILGEIKTANSFFNQALQLQPNAQRALDGVNRTKK